MTVGPTVHVGALVARGEDLLMTRTGRGPAGGVWDVPGVSVMGGEMLAEAIVRSVDECCGYSDALCGPFVGWQESIDGSGDSEASHRLTMFFHAVLLDGSEQDPDRIVAVDEVRWVSTYQIPDMRTRDGLAEFLSDQSIIDTVL